MPHIHTLPLVLFVLFDIAYVVFCVYTYARIISAVHHRPRHQRSTRKIDSERAAIVVITAFTAYIMTKWVIMQLFHGCATVAFWNPTCYDLNHLSRLWAAIYVVLALNAIAFGIIHDVRVQNKRLNDR